jgi:pSer/pThr/pTyr-binding forkhead associated (FHA) protein
MRFIYLRQIQAAGETSETLRQEFPQRELIIGRGGRSHVVITDRSVSLEHLKVALVEDDLVLTDLGGFSGVRVNGERVGERVLRSGDLISFGDFAVLVSREDDRIVLTERRTRKDGEKSTLNVDRWISRLKVDSYLPSITTLSFLLVIGVLAGCLIIPITTRRLAQWNSGPIANVHKNIQNDCQRCHLTPFEKVQDRECVSCHSMREHAANHAEFVKSHPEKGFRCAECHMDHNGDHGLISSDPRFCVSCHGDMKALSPTTELDNVSSWDHHPQFRIRVQDENGVEMRVPLDDPQRAVDSSVIKLNHALHLKRGLRGKNGPTTLQCSACHQSGDRPGVMAPVSFERHCRDCHSLGFDERLPDKEVPHGVPSDVYSFLFAQYANLLLPTNLGAGEVSVQIGGNGKQSIPRGTALPDPQKEKIAINRVIQHARTAEHEIFTKTGCDLCHTVTEKPADVVNLASNVSRYEVQKPQVPEQWFTNASFNHKPHDVVACESCHAGVTKSTKTSEILLPRVKVCQECHVEKSKPGFVESGCIMCHGYHAAQPLPREKKQDISDYLYSLTVRQRR